MQTSHTKIHLDLFLPNSKNVSLPENHACQHGWKRLYSLLQMGQQKPVRQKGRQVRNLWHWELEVLYPNIRWFQVASTPGISGSFDILLTDSGICWRCIRFLSKHIMETFIIVWVIANSIVGKHRMMLGALVSFFYWVMSFDELFNTCETSSHRRGTSLALLLQQNWIIARRNESDSGHDHNEASWQITICWSLLPITFSIACSLRYWRAAWP